MFESEIFKLLSDPTRLRIYKLLLQTGAEAAVCEIMSAVNCTHYNASRHLRLLHLSGLVNEKRKGRWVFYSARESDNPFIAKLNDAIISLKGEVYENDMARFKLRLKMRKGGKIQFCVNEKIFESINKK